MITLTGLNLVKLNRMWKLRNNETIRPNVTQNVTYWRTAYALPQIGRINNALLYGMGFRPHPFY